MTTLVPHDSSSFKFLETCQRMTTITPTFRRQILLPGTNAEIITYNKSFMPGVFGKMSRHEIQPDKTIVERAVSGRR